MEAPGTEVEGEGWRRTGSQRKEEQAGVAKEREPEEEGERAAQEGAPESEEEILHGVASILFFPSGSLSGHFLHTASLSCLGLFGTGESIST